MGKVPQCMTLLHSGIRSQPLHPKIWNRWQPSRDHQVSTGPGGCTARSRCSALETFSRRYLYSRPSLPSSNTALADLRPWLWGDSLVWEHFQPAAPSKQYRACRRRSLLGQEVYSQGDEPEERRSALASQIWAAAQRKNRKNQTWP